MKLIVGVDPGMVTAVAVLDIESDFYNAHSRRNFTFSEVCDYLVAIGEPIVVSVDTAHVPETAKRIAAAFNARLFYPKRDLYIGEKKSLAEGNALKNDHERDALAAAVHAKAFFSTLFSRVDSALETKRLSHLSADVKELLIKNEAGNIEQAIKFLAGEERKEVKIIPRLIESKKVLELRRVIEQLEKEKVSMERKIKELEKDNEKLRQPVHRDEPAVIRNLRKGMASLLSEKKTVEDNYALYKNLSFQYEILADAPERNKIAVFKDGMNVAEMEKLGPKAIISDKLLDTNIPVIHPDKIRIQKIGNFCVVRKDEIANALGKESFIEWLAQYKEMRRNEIQR